MPKIEAFEPHLDSLSTQPLFHGFTKELLQELLQNLHGKIVLFQPEEPINLATESARNPSCLGLLLTGRAFHTKHDLCGNRSIIDYVLPGHLMGCVHVFGGIEHHGTTLIAEQPCTFLYLVVPDDGFKSCVSMRGWPQLTWNIIGILSKRNLRLYRKVDILSKQTLREKILAYLSYEHDVHQSNSFTIPFNRQELSDYLYVDRTSLSTELGKLRREGMIDFWHSDFCLKSTFPKFTDSL